MRKSVILVLMLVFSFIAEAQTLPTEKVFFASDRISYKLGDTIRIAGWLTRCDDKTGEPYSRYLYVLNMQDIATVEYLTPAQSIARHSLCINGCLELTTKGFKPEAVESKGVMYTPSLGIANYADEARKTFAAPAKKGDYLMVVDCLSADYAPCTVARKVSVR